MERIRVTEVVKLFGREERAALDLLRGGADRAEIARRNGAVVGLDRVSFSVDEGEILVVMGLSGSGKSTMLRCLNRLVEPSAGSVLVDGVEVTTLSKKQLLEFRREKFGMVFQHFALFPNRTIAENVEYGLEVQGCAKARRRERALEAIELAELKDKVEVLRPNIEGARLGWAVPSYVELASIEDIAKDPSKVGGQVIGIDPGAGLMQASEKAIEDYSLDVKLVDGSDATMTAALQDAISRKEPIVVTAWTPHWMFSRWDLKYLNDPKGSLGGAETVNNVVRKGLKDEMPDVYRILSQYKLSLEDEQALMLKNEEGGNPVETAKEWVAANPEKVAAWTK